MKLNVFRLQLYEAQDDRTLACVSMQEVNALCKLTYGQDPIGGQIDVHHPDTGYIVQGHMRDIPVRYQADQVTARVREYFHPGTYRSPDARRRVDGRGGGYW